MRDYGRIAPTFWTRGSGRRLRGNAVAQVVAAYLCSAPGTNAIGLFYVPIAAIANDTGLTIEQVRAGLADVEAAGFAFYDPEVDLAFVPNGAEQQIGESLSERDRRRPMVEKELRRFGRHRFVSMFLERYGDAYSLAPFASKSLKAIPNSEKVSHEFVHASDPDPDPVPDLGESAERGYGGSLPRSETRLAAAPTTPRHNPGALVEHFVAGVNEAGGTWTCGSGKPFADLAAALQPHLAKVTEPLNATPGALLSIARSLGARWFTYCAGAPRNAWQAAAWLGEGAPTEPRPRPGSVAGRGNDAPSAPYHQRLVISPRTAPAVAS